MPLRFTANETSLSGHNYDDVVGSRYEFPSRYRNLVREGDRFVYYRGRRRLGGGTQPQVYLGAGVVGPIGKSISDPDRLVCDVLDWSPFPTPLYFKDRNGSYYEPGGTHGVLTGNQAFVRSTRKSMNESSATRPSTIDAHLTVINRLID
jgi:hypothetical protein